MNELYATKISDARWWAYDCHRRNPGGALHEERLIQKR